MQFLKTLILVFLAYSAMFGQKAIDKTIDYSCSNRNFIRILYDLEKSEGIKFIFEPKRVPYFVYTKKYEKKQAWYILQDLLSGALLKVVAIDSMTIGLIPANQVNKSYIDGLVSKWATGEYKYPFSEERFTTSISTSKPKQFLQSAKLTITLIDESEGYPLIGVAIYSDDYKISGVSNSSGIFETKVPSRPISLNMEYLGYQSGTLEVVIYSDTSVQISIPKSALLLEEVEISAAKLARNTIEKTLGVESLEMKKLSSITQAMGETDIIKSLEILPGVKSNAEVSSGFNVRGGNIDENQVLLNESIIFNPTHVLGFTSAFNADAIQSVTLSKAYMDPQYGGWNSSVLELKTSHGNFEKWKGSGAIGSAIGKLTMEGPVNRNISMMASARKSYSDWMLKQVRNKEISSSSASFYDYNIATRINLSSKHFILADHFRSFDNFDYNNEIGYKWSNTTIGVTLVNLWNDRLNTKLSMTRSYFGSVQSSFSEPLKYDLGTGIDLFKVAFNINYRLNSKLNLKGGWMLIHTKMRPETIKATQKEAPFSNNQIIRNGNLSVAPYVSLSASLSSRINTELGIRYSQYFSTGLRDEYYYAAGAPITSLNIIDTVTTNKRSSISNFLEPRWSLNYNTENNFAYKIAYTRTSQNLHLLVNANTSLPSDVWIPSGLNIKPRLADQYSVGIAYAKSDGSISMTADLYYKNYKNNVILRNFPEIIQNHHIETEIFQGIAKSYGTEWSMEFKTNKFNGNIAYTFARILQRVTNIDDQLSAQEYFAADNDIPHQVNLLVNYKSNAVLSFSTNFIYKNGRPVTLPQSTIVVDDFLIPIYSDRNTFRMPDYMRLDIGMTLDFKKVRNTGMRHSFSLGIYNILSRKNALNVFYRKSEKGNIEGYKLALIGAAIPSLSWNFIF